MDHAHLDVLRRWFEAFERSDLETAREILAPDAVLHVSKPTHLKGDYVGFDGFLDFYERKQADAGAHFRYRVDELLAGDKSAAALLTLSRMTNGRLEEWKQIAVYRIEAEQIVAMWFLEEEPG